MRVACLLYHDVVADHDWESSGFRGPGTAKYKLTQSEFEAHMSAVSRASSAPAITAYELANVNSKDAPLPFLLTFDDGGESAAGCIADVLQKYGWFGHFFVTAGQIGEKGFLTSDQIRRLQKNGHVIGSHSFSHPTRMSHCTTEELTDEWIRSRSILSDILGTAVDTASVPGGYYSRRVGETAAAAGIRVLFNSEPTTAIYSVDGCLVIGRYNIFRGSPPALSGDLISPDPGARSKQWIYWNLKKVAKRVAGGPYLAARQLLLRKG